MSSIINRLHVRRINVLLSISFIECIGLDVDRAIDFVSHYLMEQRYENASTDITIVEKHQTTVTLMLGEPYPDVEQFRLSTEIRLGIERHLLAPGQVKPKLDPNVAVSYKVSHPSYWTVSRREVTDDGKGNKTDKVKNLGDYASKAIAISVMEALARNEPGATTNASDEDKGLVEDWTKPREQAGEVYVSATPVGSNVRYHVFVTKEPPAGLATKRAADNDTAPHPSQSYRWNPRLARLYKKSDNHDAYWDIIPAEWIKVV